jgi:UDP-N-acetylmuramate dehydrogenase
MQVMRLAELTSFRIGGEAREVIDVVRTEDLPAILEEIRSSGYPFFTLGGGTNVLASDEGFDGVVLRMRTRGCVFREDGTVTVEAGFDFGELVYEAARRGLKGLEWAGGLPGTVGGAVRGNAGCFGGEMKDIVREVSSITRDGSFRTRMSAACGFSYRTSVFKRQGDEIVTAVTLTLKPGHDSRQLLEAVEEKIALRKARHPLEYPNAGSIFQNVPVERLPSAVAARFSHSIKNDPFPILPAATLIRGAGLVGMRRGGAQVSAKHANFIVNVGGARASDVRALMDEVRDQVLRAFGVELEPEICFLGD